MSARLPTDQYADSKNLSMRANLHAQYSTNPESWGNWLFREMELTENLTILDVGCGPGGLWRGNLDRLPVGCHFFLTDSSWGMVAEAQNALSDERFTFKCADVHEIPYPDGQFDCVTANHMLYHAADIDRALSEIARVLRPNGKLCAATNGDGHMRQLHDIIRRSVPSFARVSASFTLQNGQPMLERHFVDVSIRRYDDGLVVPDAGALSAYVRSMGSLAEATDWQFDEIEAAIYEQIRGKGPMRIEKSAGVFIAKGPGRPTNRRP